MVACGPPRAPIPPPPLPTPSADRPPLADARPAAAPKEPQPHAPAARGGRHDGAGHECAPVPPAMPACTSPLELAQRGASGERPSPRAATDPGPPAHLPVRRFSLARVAETSNDDANDAD